MVLRDIKLTMPRERSRAVVQTRAFLLELAGDQSLPDGVRRDARFLLRHYPSEQDVRLAGQIEEQSEALQTGILGPVFNSSLSYSPH